MNQKDIWTVAFRNLLIGKQQALKIIVGMSFVFSLIFCGVSVYLTFLDFRLSYDRDYGKQCFRIWLPEEGISPEMCVKMVHEKRQMGAAREASVLAEFCYPDEKKRPKVQDVCVEFERKQYTAVHFAMLDRKNYNNMVDGTSDFSVGIYSTELNPFPNIIYSGGIEQYLSGRFPDNPGEILVDWDFLYTFGLEEYSDELPGKKITLSFRNSETGEEFSFQDYIISGVCSTTILDNREQCGSFLGMFNHISINPRKEDTDQPVSRVWMAKCYYDSYRSFSEDLNHEGMKLDDVIEDTYMIDEVPWMLFSQTLIYRVGDWFLDNVGELLIVICAVSLVVVTVSEGYILLYYKNRNGKYLDMLESIGMQNRDRKKIFNVQVGIMAVISVMISTYLSLILVRIMHYFLSEGINFNASIHPFYSVLVMIGEILYFAIMSAVVYRVK